MNPSDSKKLEEIDNTIIPIDTINKMIRLLDVQRRWLLSKVKEQDRQLEELLNNAVPDKKWDKVFHGSVVDYLRHRAAHFIKNYHEPERGARLNQLADEVEEQDREMELLRIERDALGCQLLDVQQDCIKAKARVKELEDERKECMDSRKEAEKEKV